MTARSSHRRRPKRQQSKARRNPSFDKRALAAARRVSRLVNGPAGGDVVKLTEAERKLPKYLAVVGEVVDVSYKPTGRSTRGKYTWEHASGDRGDGKPRAKGRPLLAVDPRTKRPVWVPFKSPMKLSKRGLIG